VDGSHPWDDEGRNLERFEAEEVPMVFRQQEIQRPVWGTAIGNGETFQLERCCRVFQNRLQGGLVDRSGPLVGWFRSFGSGEILDQIEVLLQHQIDRRVVLSYAFATVTVLKQLLELDNRFTGNMRGAEVKRHMQNKA